MEFFPEASRTKVQFLSQLLYTIDLLQQYSDQGFKHPDPKTLQLIIMHCFS